MIDITRDIDSLSNFKRNTADFIRQLKVTGEPVILTVNGKAELVVLDSASYQRLLDRAENAEKLAAVGAAVEEMKKGLGTPAEEVLGEMRQILARKKPR